MFVRNYNILHYILPALKTHLIDISFESSVIEAKLVLYCEFLRPTAFEQIEYFDKLIFLLFEMKRYEGKE